MWRPGVRAVKEYTGRRTTTTNDFIFPTSQKILNKNRMGPLLTNNNNGQMNKKIKTSELEGSVRSFNKKFRSTSRPLSAHGGQTRGGLHRKFGRSLPSGVGHPVPTLGKSACCVSTLIWEDERKTAS